MPCGLHPRRVNVGAPGPACTADSGSARGGVVGRAVPGLSLFAVTVWGARPPCPLTAALFQGTLCLATDMPTRNLESKHSQMSHTFLEQRLENLKCIKDKHRKLSIENGCGGLKEATGHPPGGGRGRGFASMRVRVCEQVCD